MKIKLLTFFTFLIATTVFAARSPWIYEGNNVKMMPSGNALKADGTTIGGSGGSGDVQGAASSTDRTVSIFNGTTGKSLTTTTIVVKSNNQLSLIDGSQEVPSATFAGTTNGSAGLYLRGTNNIGMSANGTNICDWSTSRFQCEYPIRAANQDATTPAYSFNGMTDGGLYRDSASDNLRMAVNGVASQEWSDNEVLVNTIMYVNATSLPSILIMKSPDGTCARCGVSDAEAFSCASVTCP